MDRSNTRNMRGGKARFVQRNHTHSPKSPQVKKGKFATTPSSPKAGSTHLVPKLRLEMQSPQLRCARDYAERKATDPAQGVRATKRQASRSSTADAPLECTAPSKSNLIVEEGNQLALGIVLTKGRHVA
jgi:hypothetical protein